MDVKRVTKEWNQRQELLYKERAEKQAEEERRLPDKMPVPRNTTVVAEDTASQSYRSLSEDTGGEAPRSYFTPQKRYLHMAMQHRVFLPQLGGKMQDDFGCESLYMIPLLRRPTRRGGQREFAGTLEATAFKTAIRNANKIVTLADRCKLWTGGRIPAHWEVPQTEDLPQTDPPDLQLAGNRFYQAQNSGEHSWFRTQD
eukprot:6247211-Amphidinium_carterae.2